MVMYFFCGVILRFICISAEPQLRRGSSLWNGRDKKVSSSLKVRPKLVRQRNESEEEAQVAKPLLWFCEAIPPFHGSNVMKTFYASWKEGPQKACLSQLENPQVPCVTLCVQDTMKSVGRLTVVWQGFCCCVCPGQRQVSAGAENCGTRFCVRLQIV